MQAGKTMGNGVKMGTMVRCAKGLELRLGAEEKRGVQNMFPFLAIRVTKNRGLETRMSIIGLRIAMIRNKPCDRNLGNGKCGCSRLARRSFRGERLRSK